MTMVFLHELESHFKALNSIVINIKYIIYITNYIFSKNVELYKYLKLTFI